MPGLGGGRCCGHKACQQERWQPRHVRGRQLPRPLRGRFAVPEPLDLSAPGTGALTGRDRTLTGAAAIWV